MRNFDIERRPARASRTLALLAALAVLGCQASVEDRDSIAENSEDIVVGVAWPWEARSEMQFGDGLDMALQEINSTGGIRGRPLRLLRVDDQESVNEGRLVAQRLVDNPEVMAVIGHLQSHVTVPAAAIYDAGGLLLLSPASTSAELTSQSFSRVFRATFTNQAVGRQMADYTIQQGYRNVAIYYVRSIYGRALANAFEERLASSSAVSMVARDSYDPNQEIGAGTVRPILERWRNLDVDAVFLAGTVPSAGRIVAELRNAGFEAPIIGGDSLSSPGFIQLGGDATEGAVVACFFHPNAVRPEAVRFVEAFKAHYGSEPDAAAALAYDALSVLAEAMRNAPTPKPDDVAVALRTLESWRGVTGDFAFDDEGNLVGRRAMKAVVHDGRFEFLDDSPDSAPGTGASGG